MYLTKKVCREQNEVPMPKVKVTPRVQRSAGEIPFRSITFERVERDVKTSSSASLENTMYVFTSLVKYNYHKLVNILYVMKLLHVYFIMSESVKE